MDNLEDIAANGKDLRSVNSESGHGILDYFSILGFATAGTIFLGLAISKEKEIYFLPPACFYAAAILHSIEPLTQYIRNRRNNNQDNNL